MQQRQQNIFNFFRDVSKAIIAPYLDAKSLVALTEASFSTREIFKDQLKLRKDAHEIVQEVLNGTPESVKAALACARNEKGYGDNVGILLLTSTSGYEIHCQRYWKHETAIRLAANAGDLYQWIYELRPALKDEEEIAAGNIHVAIEKFGLIEEEIFLSYTVLSPTGKPVTGYLTEEELHCSLSDPLNLEELKKHLPEIISITLKRGHTTNQNLAHPEYAGTYLLNVLFEYISDEHRQLAIAQLQHLRKHGTEHGEVMAAFNQLDASYTNYTDNFYKIAPEERHARWPKDIGAKQRMLSKFGLQLFCDRVDWSHMPDFNDLPAPNRKARVDSPTEFSVSISLFPLLPAWLGTIGAMYHSTGQIAMYRLVPIVWRVLEVAILNRDVMRRACEVKLTQLDAFIGEQVRVDIEYKHQKQNSPSNRR